VEELMHWRCTMLVLKRKKGERVKVNETWVEIVEIRGGYVRLGFDGPDKVLRDNAGPPKTSKPPKELKK
jgi:hypothetical protein